MFWNYEEWTNAFLIQFFAIIVAFVVGKKNQVNKPDLILAISLVENILKNGSCDKIDFYEK